VADISPFFAVPFAHARNPDCAALHADLKRYIGQTIAAAAASKPGGLSRDARVFESRVNLFHSTEDCVRQLRDFCLAEAVAVAVQLCGYDEATSRQLQLQHGSWFRVTRRGGYLGTHNHPNSSWSGIYCIDPGRSDPDKPESGALVFTSPMQMNGMFMDASNTNILDVFQTQPRMVRMESGQLIIFPSWVLHEQRPYEGEGERITVSFTVSMGLPGRRITPQ